MGTQAKGMQEDGDVGAVSGARRSDSGAIMCLMRVIRLETSLRARCT